jgi:SAM-dependent methyltransferase
VTSRACRSCGGAFFPEPLLSYQGMPKAAQGFPDAAGLALDTGSDLEVRQCAACGLVQLANDPVPYHREVIRAAAVSAPLREAKARQFGAFIADHALAGRRVLEVGCGRGEFLALLPPLGVRASGMEAAPASVDHARREGLDAFQGYPGETPWPWPGAPYDAFLLLMFLEHLPEPGRALRAIRDQLAPGGVGLVEVPNFDMMVRRRLFSEFIADHLFYFTRDTLASLLAGSGFEVLGVDELRDAYVLSAAVRRREPLDLAEFRSAQDRIREELRAYLGRFARVAVWGASHQALAVIALAGIADRIAYVVDSAPFKQGRYTPASHLPVVPPEALRADPVDAVVIMAASYSDEVAGVLRRDFDAGIRAAILRDWGLEDVT